MQDNRIALGAAKGTKPADRDPLLACGFQPSHHFQLRSHICLYGFWAFRTITNK
jgi:hypothetical protein